MPASEGRVFVTLDLDFANPFRFDPRLTAGLAVLRVSETPDVSELEAVASRLLDALATRDIRGRLWVVDGHRVREYRGPDRTTDE